jgi:hypothetical protein
MGGVANGITRSSRRSHSAREVCALVVQNGGHAIDLGQFGLEFTMYPPPSVFGVGYRPRMLAPLASGAFVIQGNSVGTRLPTCGVNLTLSSRCFMNCSAPGGSHSLTRPLGAGAASAPSARRVEHGK